MRPQTRKSVFSLKFDVVRMISMLVCLFRIIAALVYMLVYPVDVSLWLDVLYFLQIEQLRDAERAAVRFADLFCCVTSEFAFYLSTTCPDQLPAYLLPLSTCSVLLRPYVSGGVRSAGCFLSNAVPSEHAFVLLHALGLSTCDSATC